jgi:hypothetical protein
MIACLYHRLRLRLHFRFRLRSCSRLALALLAGAVFVLPPALAQAPADSASGPVRAGLVQRELWGRDYPLLIRSIPAWAQIQEKTILIAPDVIIGGTPFRTAAEAERPANRLRTALAQAPAALGPDFATAAREAGTGAAKIEVRRYGGDGSYRVVIGRGLGFLPAELTIAAVQRVLGKEESVRREVEDGGGEHRPVVYTSHAWGGGALIVQTSNYAPAPDQVVRVVLGVPSAMRAVSEAR